MKSGSSLIATFKRGILKVLVNVAVAIEGFDLPDASCVVITRPTKSLTLDIYRWSAEACAQKKTTGIA